MLRSLQVKNYVLIDSLETEFPSGLVIITGETGAGKSILLGAISLLLGAKADSSAVGDSGENCIVEGEFDCHDDHGLEEIFREEDLDWNDGAITVRRVVGRTGRSRSFIGDEPVSREALSRISSRLVDIHSQHENLILSDAAFRLQVLDSFCGVESLRNECSAAWKALAAARKSLAGVNDRIEKLRREQDFNSTALRQLQDAALRAGEMEELEREQKRLSGAEEIKEALGQASSLYDGAEEGGSLPVSSSLKEISRAVSRLGRYIPETGDLVERIESVRTELQDIFSELYSYAPDGEDTQSQLEAVEQRMSRIYDLMTRHGVRTEEELMEIRDHLSCEAGGLSSLEDEKISLEKEVTRLEEQYSTLSGRLHDSRVEGAPRFAGKISDSLHSLSLEQAAFGVEIAGAAPGAYGADTVEFLFDAAGRRMVDVRKGASGGEMSRIMLAIKDLMARFTAMPTLIFDEIDTGISGSVADKVGSMICRMGEDMQVFAITHLPQVAAKGDAHFLVSKEMDAKGNAVTGIRKIEGKERVMEISRMLSGSTVTPEATANAESLLRSSQTHKRHA